MSNEMDESFIVEFSLGEVEFGKATPEIWDGFLEHLRKGGRKAGEWELVQKCCVSLKMNEHTGFHDLDKYVEEEPAAIAEIADEIERISGGGQEPEVEGKTVKCAGFTFKGPNRTQWDSFKENAANEEMRGGSASRQLLFSLVDDADAFKAFLDKRPAALASIMVAVSKLAGRGIKIKQKK